jgi:hypothetical protein
MSATEDEESDCDLAPPPPKRPHLQIGPESAASRPDHRSAIRDADDDDPTADEEDDIVELSHQQYRDTVSTAAAAAAAATATTAVSALPRTPTRTENRDTTSNPLRDKYSALVRRDITNCPFSHLTNSLTSSRSEGAVER